ncbi:MAG TPA: methyltransferase type 11 [Cyanobacteria bacterium UBA11371]|nr:methyltransferase type 11 [Cyanobacteria bacterium UBA11371]HBE32639.1 methyltransferase type 11 [Cyanobacteria bacterium UBA11368]
MPNAEYENQYKKTVVDFFNSRTNYDNDYTIRRTLPLLDLVWLKKGYKVLDVATGTGIIAIAAAQIVGTEGKVIGVDFSSGMLNQARRKIEELGWQNIELIEADAEYLNFDIESFDAIICGTAIVYFRDISAILRNWYRWLKPGGIVAFSCCSDASCEAPLILKVSAKYGIPLLNINEPTGTPEKCCNLLQEVGFRNVLVQTKQLGFYREVEEMGQWNGLWFHPRENPLSQLTSEQMEQLKAEYRKEVEARATERGVWYENMTFFVTGQKLINLPSRR